MKLSLTLDEVIYNQIGINRYLDPLLNSVAGVELTIHPSLFSVDSINSISKYCNSNDLSINYHAPDFVDYLYRVESFDDNKLRVCDAYVKLLNSIDSIQGVLNSKGVVAIHGAEINDSHNKSYNTTLRFFDWLLNYMIQMGFETNIALETLPNRISSIGISRKEIIDILREFNTPRLGCCLDIAHDFYNNEYLYKELDDLYEFINYVHIHGIKNTTPVIDHIGLRGSDLIYDGYINTLYKNDYNGFINLEILSSKSKEYDTDILDSIHDLESTITGL